MASAVILSPDPSNAAGGVERMCELLAAVLEDDGWRVTVVGPGREPAAILARTGAGYLERSRLAMSAARRLSPDLIVSNGYLGMGPRANALRVHVFHGTMVNDTRAEGPGLARRERFRRAIGGGAAEALAGRGASVVSVSEATAAEVRRLYRIETDAVIPNGIDTKLFSPRPRQRARAALGLAEHGRYCLFVGRVQHRKGSDLLLSACRQAGYELLLAGADALDGARHLGVLGAPSLADAYCACDCVLFPTRYEACSYVVLEALACEAPLVTTTAGWMSSFLDGVPEYARLCVLPEPADVLRGLRELSAGGLEPLTRRARDWVVQNNDLFVYASRWRALLAQLGLAQPALGVR